MLQSFCKVMGGSSTGERSRKGDLWDLHSQSWSSLLNPKEEMEGGRTSHFLGYSGGGLFLLMFGYGSETAKHLFVSKIYIFSSTKFSKFRPCFACKEENVCVALCGVFQEYGSQREPMCLPSASLAVCCCAGSALGRLLLRLPNTRTRL